MTRPTELEQAIAAWGRHDPLAAGDEAALLRILEHAEAVAAGQPPRRSRVGSGWLLGGAVAASAAIALLLVPGLQNRPAPAASGSTSAAAAAPTELSDGVAFALLYTPTPEEEYLL
jgi:hypothetical protein